MNILIYGGKGWIGSMFIELLDRYKIKYYCGYARVDKVKNLIDEIECIKPTHIISFIGRTHGEGYTTIDYLEQDGKLVENIRDNLFSPFVLAQLCNQYDIHYTYLGTGCIFTYNLEHPYGKEENGFTENDLPNFFGSSYSVVKGFTDQMMQLYSNVLNLRIRMPITHIKHTRNFITKITSYKKICSVPNSMTVLPELLPYVIDMMFRKLTGTINLVNPGLITHNEILEMYKNMIDPEFIWENFTIEEQNNILKAERSNNYLDTTKLTTLYPNICNIKEAIQKCLIQYNL
jgi:dTDP-4-dehydrorhamnose reductase